MRRIFFGMAFCGLFLEQSQGAGNLLGQAASSSMAARSNPYEGSPQAGNDARRAGAKLYARECSACHGPNREGRRNVPPLNQAEISQTNPGALFWVLRNGSLYRGMPSFAHLPEPERWQIVTFLRNR